MKHLMTGAATALLLLASAHLHPATAQSWAWANAASTTPNAESWAEKVAFDAAGNAVVAGHFSGTLVLGRHTLVSAGGEDVFVARVDATGDWAQAVRAGGPADDYAMGLAVAPDGTATVVGGFESKLATFGSFVLPNSGSNSSTQDVFIARLSPAGVWTQAARAGGQGHDHATAVALAPDGTATVVGGFQGPTAAFAGTLLRNTTLAGGFEDVFVARFSAAGLWTRAISAGSADTDHANAVAVAPDGSAVVVGTFYGEKIALGTKLVSNSTGNSGPADVFVARLTPAGDWDRAAGLGGSANDEGFGVALHANGDATVVGSFASPTLTVGPATLTNNTPGNTMYTDVFVARLSAAGTWTQAVSAGGNRYDWLNSVAVDAQDRAVVAGSFTSTSFTAGMLMLSNTTAPTTHNEVLVGTLDANGHWSSLCRAGGPQLDIATSVAYSPLGRVVVAGVIHGPAAQFGPTTLVAAKPAAFVASLGQLPLTSRPAATATLALGLAPNPAHGSVRVSLPATAAATPLQVLDATGRELRRLAAMPGRETTLDLSGLAPGLYLLRAGAATGRLLVE
ncbi:T9SS type A sorting domain-containing protein [Hymenobacter sp. ASUV-10]|uniref:T9SS type A sorting domain-containing protein n=1 Tax=Hymenobacter aranciens TaxID=3063996 RepID=A0ABT9BIG0_9BACT|nr:T9SS type A sorting domain-containing protein [Hymenobacter sp. ASUV-10]MDO7877479.1 T9SS type A sorting domain-containing protein [Hymenobacter sp. ASUV-10]